MLGSLLRAASTLLRKRVREPEAAELPRPAKRPAVEHAEVPGGAARDCGYLASTHGRARATCRAPPRGTWALLPADLLLQLSSLLPLADRLALRLACAQFAGAVTFCGLRLPIPLPARHVRALRPLAARPEVSKLDFVQDGCGRLEKRAFKRVLKALDLGAGQGARRFQVRLALGAPLTAADLAWLQAAFAGAGLLACCASFHLACTEAALGSFCLLLCQVTSIAAEWCSRLDISGVQVDTLHLTVERIGSACRGLRSGVYANLESLAVTHVACEDDVQDVLAVVGVAHSPRLRHLQIQAAPAPAGSNARPVVVGCRGPHPDLRQLARLAMDPSITLCINLLRYLSSLPGLSLSEGLQRAVDAYLSRRQSVMFLLMFGHHEEEQHGFLAGEQMIQFNPEEEGESDGPD